MARRPEAMIAPPTLYNVVYSCYDQFKTFAFNIKLKTIDAVLVLTACACSLSPRVALGTLSTLISDLDILKDGKIVIKEFFIAF